MRIRYPGSSPGQALSRPVKPGGRKKAACTLSYTVAASVAREGTDTQTPVKVTNEERGRLAEALAYFCVACGREHASGSVRHDDLACAEAEITAVIRHAQ